MIRRLFVLLVSAALVAFVAAPAEAHSDRGSLYSKERYNNPYSFVDRDCGFPFRVKGRAWGLIKIYNVKGSDGQAYLADDRWHFRETLKNPKNGKKMFVSGHGRFTELKARHLRGDIWKFFAVDRVHSFKIRNSHGKVVLREHGKIGLKSVQDTLGDGEPGSEVISEEIVFAKGQFPTLEPDFDFCRLVDRLIG
jgi:hypothetical protein